MAKNLRLKAARVEHDMTQGDLAEAVGATRQTIGLIEAGKYNPSLALCIAICMIKITADTSRDNPLILTLPSINPNATIKIGRAHV